MSCQGYRDWIEPYLDGELDSPSQAAFEEHLIGCTGCQRELARARAMFSLLDGLQDEPVPARLRSQVMAGLPNRGAAPWLRWVLAGQVAVTAVLLVLAYPTLAAWSGQASQWLEPGWLSSLVRTTGLWLAQVRAGLSSLPIFQGAWAPPRGLNLNWMQAIISAVVLGGMWLAGNRLLFSQANRTGGTR